MCNRGAIIAALIEIIVLVGLTDQAPAGPPPGLPPTTPLVAANEGDGNATLTYNPENGEFGIVVGPTLLTLLQVVSDVGIFTGPGPTENLDGTFDSYKNNEIFKARYNSGFGSDTFGSIVEPGLAEEFVRNDLSALGALLGGGNAGAVDLVYISAEPSTPLQAGDANMDFEFNQFDLVQVQQAAKYLTGEPANWGEGDWNGAPGGSSDDPPAGDGVFDNIDIVAALQTGNYMQGSYAALTPGYGGDGYVSAMGNGLPAISTPLGGVDNGVMDLVYVPEPSTFLLSTIAMIGLIAGTRRRRR